MITIQAAPLPTDFRGTPQEMLDAWLDRIEIVSDLLGFVLSDTQPSSNQGPWLKNGNQIWVWDETDSTYVPLDVSASAHDQIWVGEVAPDFDNPEQADFRIWLKLLGSTVVGLFYYTGSVTGWVQKTAELSPGSVTELMYADDSITTSKIRNLAVTAAKLANNLPLSKWERGSAFQTIRMKSDASLPEWTRAVSESVELTLAEDDVLEVSHDLGVVPRYLHAVLVCKEAEGGWSVGEEIDFDAVVENYYDGLIARYAVFRSTTKIGLRYNFALYLWGKTDSAYFAPLTNAKWKLKFYFGAG